ncbi:SURF1 family protein [Pseudoalteromonas luteoviolacea]|uniref:SURF1 family protein n=1 Tax=Pseudoalteromonas luteoviolacea TaxID=43657 RepID=UPI001B38C919|nr:SURF1 family protein [Pseudoalteromonas luteoviolacea]
MSMKESAISVFNKKTSTVLVILAVIVVMLVCFRLSYWQWQRATNKQALLAQLTERSQNQKTLFSQDPDSLQGVKAVLTGKLDQKHWWLLDNQIVSGQVGYDLIAIFDADDSAERFVINLGFVPAGKNRSHLPEIALPSGKLQVNAQFKIGNWSGFTLAEYPNQSAHHSNVLQYLEHTFFSRELEANISPLLLIADQAVIEGITPHYEAVVMSPEKHRAYALQWLLIGLSAGVIALFASKRESGKLKYE